MCKVAGLDKNKSETCFFEIRNCYCDVIFRFFNFIFVRCDAICVVASMSLVFVLNILLHTHTLFEIRKCYCDVIFRYSQLYFCKM